MTNCGIVSKAQAQSCSRLQVHVRRVIAIEPVYNMATRKGGESNVRRNAATAYVQYINGHGHPTMKLYAVIAVIQWPY